MKNKIMTLLVISLLVIMPIYSSLVIAWMSNPRLYGEDGVYYGVYGYARNNEDDLTFEIDASTPDLIPVETYQVRLFGVSISSGTEFNSCESINNYYRCKLTEDFSRFDFCGRYSEPPPFVVYLYEQGGTRISESVIDILCDYINPAIISLSIENGVEQDGKYYFGASDDIVFEYYASDSACDEWGCKNKCSGLKEIKFYKDSISPSKVIYTEALPYLCENNGYISVSASSFSDGDTDVYARVFDRFDQYDDSDPFVISIDSTPPGIDLEDFEIRDSQGQTIEYFIPGDVKLSFSVEIEEEELDKNSVVADLSGLGLGANVKGSCGSTSNDITICSWNNLNYNLETNSFSGSVTVRAQDNYGNEQSEQITLSETLKTDNGKPSIGSLRVTTTDGEDISGWIGPDPFDAYVYVEVSDSETGIDTVKADLSDLNPIYIDVTPTVCTEGAATISCRWDIDIDLATSGQVTKNLIFEASDKVLNSRVVALPYSFKVDDIAPVVTSLYSATQDSTGINYLKARDNVIIGTFTETGIGLDKNGVFLDLQSIGRGSQVSATRCEKAGSSWICYWENIDTTRTSGTHDISIVVPTRDLFGNTIAEPYTSSFVVDVTGPEVNYITITPVAGSNPVVSGYIQTGNALLIEASIIEPGGLKAVADLSKVIQGEYSLLPDQSCTQNGDDWLCTWSTDEIDIEGYIVDNLVFTFTDLAGNSEIHEEPIIVLEPSEIESDYWDVVIDDYSPSAIDRELVNIYDPFMWFKMRLVSKEGLGADSRWPVEVTIDECTGDNAVYLASTFRNLPELYNYNPTIPANFPYPFYLKYTLERVSPDEDELDISCSLNIRTLVDGTSISKKETENIIVTINYYNNPLGTIDGNIEDEIDKVKNNWLVKAEWIESVQTIMRYAKLACSIMNKLKNIQQMLAFAKDRFSNCCSLWPASPCCLAAAQQGLTTVAAKEATQNAWFKDLNKWCKIFSCRFGQKENGKDPWSSTNNEFLGGVLDYAKKTQGRTGTRQGYWGNVDPQHSLILSAATLCLPGVIYNLQKARAIDCYYISCLERTKDGLPLYMCVDQRAYAYCKFVWGEVFQAIPFTAVISQIGQNIQKALSHPFELVGFTLKAYCTLTCISPINQIGRSCLLCTIVEYMNIAMDVLCDLGIGGDCEPVWDSLSVDSSICSQVLDTGEEDEDDGGFLGIF